MVDLRPTVGAQHRMLQQQLQTLLLSPPLLLAHQPDSMLFALPLRPIAGISAPGSSFVALACYDSTLKEIAGMRQQMPADKVTPQVSAKLATNWQTAMPFKCTGSYKVHLKAHHGLRFAFLRAVAGQNDV